ncbi:MAG: hypothetical protein M1816_005951 [Peltula sp. TS41687]|nr:MAG: hypothetical protein M1816_005951 [Peltula sp. TS41687]
MSTKPIFVATHPRACSTAFERVFMTRHDILHCIHEPFGDAFYFGPERLSERYEEDEKGRIDSGFSNTTYQTVLDRIEGEAAEHQDKRVFIKDITHYLVPSNDRPASIAPSILGHQQDHHASTKEPDGIHHNLNGVMLGQNNNNNKHKPSYPYPTAPEPNNPTVVPKSILQKFHFTFLIRHPQSSVPSYYRCTIPPLDQVTGFYSFMPTEMGYDELRRVFDYLRAEKLVGPRIAGQQPSFEDNKKHEEIEICVTTRTTSSTTQRGSYPRIAASDEQAEQSFAKWKGFHEDAIHSQGLKKRESKKAQKTDEEYDGEWIEKFGEEAARTIRETVNGCLDDYRYLKRFALKNKAAP